MSPLIPHYLADFPAGNWVHFLEPPVIQGVHFLAVRPEFPRAVLQG